MYNSIKLISYRISGVNWVSSSLLWVLIDTLFKAKNVNSIYGYNCYLLPIPFCSRSWRARAQKGMLLMSIDKMILFMLIFSPPVKKVNLIRQ